MENENTMQLEFSVRNQVVKRTDNNTVVENSENYLLAHFEFSDDWNGLNKQAHFTWNGLAVYYVDINSSTNSCYIPSEVIKARGFQVCVQGKTSSGTLVKVTTTPVQVMVMDSGQTGEMLPAVTSVESNTILVTKTVNKLKIEIPNIYAKDAAYDSTTGNLILKGLNGEVIKTLSLPIKSILEGNLTVKKAECDSNGNVIITTYATKSEVNAVNTDLQGFKTTVSETYSTKTELASANAKTDGVKTYADNTFATKSDKENLQSQIDSINAKADVVAVVGTKAQLALFDKAQLTDKDIVKVLKDESNNNSQSYYQYATATQTFTLIGSVAESYTKAETDTLISGLQTQITSNDTDISGLQSGKLDKVTTTGTYIRAYTVNAGGVQGVINIASGDTSAWSVVARDANGCAKVANPKTDTDAINKKYLEDNHYNKTAVDALVTTEVETVASGTTTLELADDKIYKISGTCTSFTPTFPSGINESYCTEVRFSSGATPTEIGSGNFDVFDGFDCEDGDFIPMPYTDYKMIYSKGKNGMTVIVARG